MRLIAPFLVPLLVANAAAPQVRGPLLADAREPELVKTGPITPDDLPTLVIPPAIPLALEAMLNDAIDGGNDGEIDTIAKYTSKVAPRSANAIRRRVARFRDDRTRRHEEMVEAAGMFDLWKGKAEVGGWLTTGNTRNVGLTGVVDLTREGLQWRHKLHLQVDYQRSLGVTTREHYLASYEPNYKIDERSYIYGSSQYESDRFLGYYNRYSLSVGGGYTVLKGPRTTLSLELGPGYRATEFTDDVAERSLAVRGSVDFGWKLTPAITLTQNASAYLQQYNSTVSGTTALNAKLFGPLSAQLSYNFQYESEPPTGSVSTDTTSRASVVYSF